MLYDWISNPKSTFHTAPEANDAYTLPGIVQAQPMPPPLVDASDLLADPNKIVKQYCESLGVPFDQSMLSWESGNVSAFNAWQGYHTAAEQSTGFKTETPTDVEAEEAAKVRKASSSNILSTASDTDSSGNDSEGEAPKPKTSGKKNLPAEVLEAIGANMDSYNYLYTQRSFKKT
jgi:hypothetical protein